GWPGIAAGTSGKFFPAPKPVLNHQTLISSSRFGFMRGGSMATKPKAAAPPPDDDEADAESKDRATATEAQPKKTSLVGRILALPRLLNPLAFLKLSLKMK